MQFTVIIATCDRPERLADTLRRLAGCAAGDKERQRPVAY
jgi:hypothetical protein